MNKFPVAILLLLSIIGLLSLSCGMANAIFATPTPTTTNTPTITPSPTATNTPVPTSTSTPLPTGILINEIPGGGTEFIDYDGGYKLTVPTGWTAIPLEEETIDRILSAVTDENAQHETIINYLTNVDKSIYRIFFFDFRTENTNGQFVSNINALYQKDQLISGIPLDFIVSATEENLTSLLPGVEVFSTRVITLKSGIQAGEIEISQRYAAFDGTEVSAYQKIIIFLSNDGMVNITFSMLIEQQDTLQSEIDQTIDSIMLLTP